VYFFDADVLLRHGQQDVCIEVVTGQRLDDGSMCEGSLRDKTAFELVLEDGALFERGIEG